MSSAVLLATAGYDRTIRFWEAPSGACTKSLQYTDSQVNKLEITPDKRFLAAAGNPHIRLFDITSSNPHPIMSFDGHTGNITSLGFNKDSRWMYTGSEDGTVKVWDTRAPGCQRDYESKAGVNAVALHPNQGELISGDQDGVIQVWDLTANRCVKTMSPSPSVAIRSITTASDGSIATCANTNGTCFVWPITEAPPPSLAADGLPNERRSTTVTAKLPVQAPFTAAFQAHDAYVLKCLLSPDTKLLATTSSDKTIRIWDASTHALKHTLHAHQRWVWDCVFSADSAYLVSASSDNTARLWDLASGEAIKVYLGHSKAVTCVALNDSAPER
eukprot:c10515_g1_i1.p1 GENE.c10515_g1_i1~~c10515_g1_i1.p1  ORF type:complete len:341 (+),score=50.23 c10515_g1_i1:35-1024(+)